MTLPTLGFGSKMLSENRTIAQGTGGSPVDVTSYAVPIGLRMDAFAGIYLSLEGEHASANGIVSFYFQHSPDGTNWYDLPAVTLTMAGTAVVTSQYSWASLDMRGIRNLRLASIGNADTTYDATCNAWYVAKPTQG